MNNDSEIAQSIDHSIMNYYENTYRVFAYALHTVNEGRCRAVPSTAVAAICFHIQRAKCLIV